jgi:hypothetical protein
MNDKSQRRIVVYCPPGKSAIERRCQSTICATCESVLVDLDASGGGEIFPGRKDRFVCGFRSAATAGVVAASLALSACEDKSQSGTVGLIDIRGRLVSEIEGGDYPVAKRDPRHPNMVISPYTGQSVLVDGIPPGSLVTDPRYRLEDRKYFRLPEDRLDAPTEGEPAGAGQPATASESEPDGRQNRQPESKPASR